MKIRTSSYVAVGAAVGLALGAFAYTGITAARPGVQQVARTAADGGRTGAVPADDAADDGEVVLQGVQPAVDAQDDAAPDDAAPDDSAPQAEPTTTARRPRPATSTSTTSAAEPAPPAGPTSSPSSSTTPPRDDD